MTQDSFPPVKRLRDLVVGAAGRGSSLAELVECGWCAGFWITGGVRLARRFAPRWWGPVAEVFAAAMVASYFVGKSTEEGDPKDVAEAIDQATNRLDLVPTSGTTYTYDRVTAAQLREVSEKLGVPVPPTVQGVKETKGKS